MAVRFTARAQRPSAPSAKAERYTHAVTLHGAGQVARALAVYRELLAARPFDPRLPELAGIACMQLERYEEALVHLRLAERSNPENASVYSNLGGVLERLGEIPEAIQAFRSALDKRPESHEVRLSLGLLLEQSGQGPAAANALLALLDGPEPLRAPALQALRRMVSQPLVAAQVMSRLGPSRQSNDAAQNELLALARINALVLPQDLGSSGLLTQADALAAKGDLGGAVLAMEAFLRLAPDNAAGWNNLGVLHRRRCDSTAALHALRRATELSAHFAAAWSNLGACLLDAADLPAAQRALERALAADPTLANAHANLGMLHRARHNPPQALECYQRALELDDSLFEAHLNLGNLRHEHGDDAGAASAFRRAAALRPADAEAAYSVGITDPDLAQASSHLNRALALRLTYPQAEVARVFTQLRACDWSALHARLARVEAMVQDPAMPALPPLWMLALSGSRPLQQLCARKWTREKVLSRVPAKSPAVEVEVARRDSVVRVGVLSGDLRDHAVGQLLVDVLPRIDASRCELFAYDVSPNDDSPARRALRAAFGVLRDVPLLGPAALAARMQADGLDVLVDLAGYSQHSRSPVLGLRPAPVQVSWLGFPGTMGWDAVDWLVADDHLVPASHEQDYDEGIARLPLCYQPARRFASKMPAPSRRELGLPQNALVLASFANPYKLRPELFACWLRLLRANAGSVLWLAAFNDSMPGNLRQAARAQGVDPDRLVFAPVVDIDRHLARLPLADLCLDTAPYGAGVTATQSLSAGVPLLTLAGETYVGRMASSLLHALDLPELVAADLGDYETRALRLAGDDGLRAQLRARLAQARDWSPVFDPARSARDLEQLFLRLAANGRGTIHQ